MGMTEDVPEYYTELSFVCLREDGCLEFPVTVETACRTAARKVPELEGFHFHTLRHTYTTNLLSNGAQPKPFVYLALCTKGALIPFIAIAAISLFNVVLSGSPIAGVYPWTASYLLLTGRLAQAGAGGLEGMAVILFLCVSGIGANFIRFQKEDIV